MAIEETKVLLQHCLSVNPIFVVICGPKQPLQNYLSKASFMLFVFFKSTKWKHAYLLLPLKPERFSRMLSQFSHMLSSSIIAGVWALWFMGGPPTDLKNMAVFGRRMIRKISIFKNIHLGREQSFWRKEWLPTTHQETKYAPPLHKQYLYQLYLSNRNR